MLNVLRGREGNSRMGLSFVRRIFVVAFAALFCASSFAVDLIPVNNLPQWFQDQVIREVQISEVSNIKIEQLSVDAEIVGKASLEGAENGTWYYLIDIGTDAPVECYVFSVFDGSANSLYALIEQSFVGIEAIYDKPVSAHFNYAIDVGVIGTSPYLSLDTFYNVGEGAETLSGVVKAMSAQTGDSLQICLHNEVGYKESFRKVFYSFTGALEQAKANDAFFTSAYKMSINGVPMGFGSETMAIDEDGDVSMTVRSSMLVPVDASNVSRTDSMSKEWSRPDGSLINLDKYTVENGALSMQFAVSESDEAWSVAGQMQGKEMTFTLDHSGALVSSFGNYLEAASLLSSEKESVQLSMWSEVNPNGVLSITSRKLKDREDANIQTDFGPLIIEALADKNGVPQSGTIKQGPINIELEMMATQGLPVLP